LTTRKIILSGLAAGLLLQGVLGQAFASGSISPTHPAIGAGVVHRVIDGDTYDVNLDSPDLFSRFVSDAAGDRGRQRYLNERHRSIRVRLANVDTPESVHANAQRNSREGAEISAQVKLMIEGKPVRVLCHDWGRYGRSICNVQIDGVPAGDVGLWLIQQGYSPYVTRWGRNPYLHREYQQAQAE